MGNQAKLKSTLII